MFVHIASVLSNLGPNIVCSLDSSVAYTQRPKMKNGGGQLRVETVRLRGSIIVESRSSSLKYFTVALMHIPCYDIFSILVRLKHYNWLSRSFPGSYRFVPW
ncbi:hypothetical protein HN51_016220 [Arachis hypogaea]